MDTFPIIALSAATPAPKPDTMIHLKSFCLPSAPSTPFLAHRAEDKSKQTLDHAPTVC